MRATVVLLCLSAACALRGEEPRGIDVPAAERRAEVVRILEPLIQGHYARGLVIGITNGKDHEVIGLGALGPEQVGEPGDAVFEIGSVSKTFTALLLADLAARGRVALDDPISRHLPESVRLQGGDTPVLLAQLAQHTSGLPRVPSNSRPKDLMDPNADYGEKELLEFLSTWTPTRKAGEAYEYSNLGAGLLGYVMSRVEGRTYEEMVLDRICGPLRMGSTRVVPTDDMKPRTVQGHEAGGGPVAAWSWDALAGAGALRSTANDLLRYLDAQLAPPEGELGTAIRLTHSERTAPGIEPACALGWHPIAQDTFAHAGGTYGHSSYLSFDLRRGVGLVVLADSGVHGWMPPTASQVFLYLCGEPHTVPELPVEIDLPLEELAALAGRYQFEDGEVVTIRLEGSGLQARVSDTGEVFHPIFPTKPGRFLFKNAPVGIAFEVEAGKATSLTLVSGRVELKATRIDHE